MDDNSESKDLQKKFYKKNQEELDKLGMPPRPLADQGIKAYEEWEKELFKRRIEYNRKNVPLDNVPLPVHNVVEDIEEEVPIQQPIQQSIDKNKMNIYVKLLSGDIIPLEINPNFKISAIKEIIKNEFKSQMPISNSKLIVLFDNEGNYFEDDIIIKRILKENDMINVFINITDEPPFKGEKWIKFNHSTRDLEHYKKFTKKMNPVIKYKPFEYLDEYLKRIGEYYPVQVYEGNLDDFIIKSDYKL